jgi:L-amino acid N-acyltransferase YncA
MRDIRHASAADADAIAGLHAASWQATYRGILPDTYLRDEVGPERLAYWRAAMARGDYALVRVLCEDAKAIGFSALKTGQDEGYDYTLEHHAPVAAYQGPWVWAVALMADTRAAG